MAECLNNEAAVPQWYADLEGERIAWFTGQGLKYEEKSSEIDYIKSFDLMRSEEKEEFI